MSELSVKVAREHVWLPGACTCGEPHDGRPEWRARHIAAMTEAAVREAIAADIEASRDALDPDDHSGGPAYESGIRYGLTIAAAVTRGES